MISTILNHCKEMGAEPGRRFLKQPAAKLEPVIVGPTLVAVCVIWTSVTNDNTCIKYLQSVW